MLHQELEATRPFMGTVMLASDLSEEAASAQRYAVSLAGTFGAELCVLYVSRVQPMLFPEELTMALYQDRFRTEIDRQLDALVQGIRKEGIRAKAVQRVGQPDDTILDAVNEARPDLVVLGNHPRRPHQYVLTTGIVDHVVRSASCPVLTVPASFGGDAGQAVPACIRRLVVVVDGSESALVACEYAAELAQPHGASVTMLVVMNATNGTRGADAVEALADAMRGGGLEVHVRLERGETSSVVTSYAKAHGCDCVLVGLRVPNADALTSDLVPQVIAQAVCPVMTVKNPRFPPGWRSVPRHGGDERSASGQTASESATASGGCHAR